MRGSDFYQAKFFKWALALLMNMTLVTYSFSECLITTSEKNADEKMSFWVTDPFDEQHTIGKRTVCKVQKWAAENGLAAYQCKDESSVLGNVYEPFEKDWINLPKQSNIADWKLKDGVLIMHGRTSTQEKIIYGAWDYSSKRWREKVWVAPDQCSVTEFTTQGGVVAWICKRPGNQYVEDGWRIWYRIFYRGDWLDGEEGQDWDRNEIKHLDIRDATVNYNLKERDRDAGYDRERGWGSFATVPISYFAAGPKLTGKPHLKVWFADMSIAGKEIRWDFGDSESSTAQCPLHTFKTGGDFEVTQTIKGAYDTKSTYSKTVNVESLPEPTAYFEATPSKGAWPLTVRLVDNSKGPVTSYHWEFADGQQSTERNPSHTYYVPGIYFVTLTVTGPGGTDTYRWPVIVHSLPNGVKCGDSEGLISAIEAAVNDPNGGIINLNPDNNWTCRYVLKQPYNWYFDPAIQGYTPTGLPEIHGPVIINGHGSAIERDTSSPPFRIFFIRHNGALRLNKLRVTFGSVTGSGGGILNTGSLSLSETTVSQNEATNGGGGISNVRVAWSANAFLYRSTVSDNFSYFLGGGIYNRSGTFIIMDSTVSNNTASGGIYNSYGRVSLRNATIMSNLYYGVFTTGYIDMINTIIAKNTGQNCWGRETYFRSGGFNIDGDGSCVKDSNIDMPNTDPGLGSLVDNGGLTKTHLPAESSPVIDPSPILPFQKEIACSYVDQRGLRRVDHKFGDVCDIGAVEYYQTLSRAHWSFTVLQSPEPQLIRDGIGCPAGGAVKFRFTARLQVRDPVVLVGATDLMVQVDSDQSSKPLVLQNADGGPGWDKEFMTVPRKDGYEDGILQGDEFVDVPFVVCLGGIHPFTLWVNVRGVQAIY